MTKLLVVWALLVGLASLCSAAPATDPLRLADVVQAMKTPGVTVTVHWEECGQVNAYYSYKKKTVTLCTELLGLPPGFIRYVLAHELAHAVIIQRNVPYTGNHEAAADELAAVMLIYYGMAESVREGALFWANRGLPEDPEDEHPGDLRRATDMLTLYWGSKNIRSPYFYNWYRASHAWLRLLNYEKAE